MGSPSLTVRFVSSREMICDDIATPDAWVLDELLALYIFGYRLTHPCPYIEIARGRVLRHRPATLGTVSRLFKEVPQ